MLFVCLHPQPRDGSLLVLATTSEPGCMRDLGLHFQRIVSDPCIERKDDFTTLLRAFTDDGITQEVADAIGSQICESLTGCASQEIAQRDGSGAGRGSG